MQVPSSGELGRGVVTSTAWRLTTLAATAAPTTVCHLGASRHVSLRKLLGSPNPAKGQGEIGDVYQKRNRCGGHTCSVLQRHTEGTLVTTSS